jgi:hypothetical protein
MSEKAQDELWPHFAPLWIELREVAPALLLAGGYGLFLKQQWLISQLRFLGTGKGHSIVTEKGEKLIVDEVRTLVAIHQWHNQTPRVTKDFDFIASLDLIASGNEQMRLQKVLQKHGFEVVPNNARWQFAKRLSAERNVVLDFHAPAPGRERGDLRMASRRVKPKPSLGQMGIHGRVNPEAVSAGLQPFSFTWEGLQIVLPNSVTLALMKLIAMRDRRVASLDASLPAEDRQREEQQAKKHAEDVCRVMAMVTREESDTAAGVLHAVRQAPAYVDAEATFSKFFKTDEGWGSQAVAGVWRREDFQLIRDTLATWLH